jgi:hypothetical protein
LCWPIPAHRTGPWLLHGTVFLDERRLTGCACAPAPPRRRRAIVAIDDTRRSAGAFLLVDVHLPGRWNTCGCPNHVHLERCSLGTTRPHRAFADSRSRRASGVLTRRMSRGCHVISGDLDQFHWRQFQPTRRLEAKRLALLTRWADAVGRRPPPAAVGFAGGDGGVMRYEVAPIGCVSGRPSCVRSRVRPRRSPARATTRASGSFAPESLLRRARRRR